MESGAAREAWTLFVLRHAERFMGLRFGHVALAQLIRLQEADAIMCG